MDEEILNEEFLNEEETNSNTESFSPFFGSAIEVMNRYLHCAICGSNLHFSHVTDFSRNMTQESSRCPECGYKAQGSIHKLQ